MSKKMFKMSLIFILIALLCATGSVFAYFVFRSAPKSDDVSLGATEGASEWVQKVASAFDLALYGTDSRFNSKDETSTAAARKVLLFDADITLLSDLELTNDVHLDLAGHTLNLAGKKLIFSHPYFGELVIRGGEPGTDKEGNAVSGAQIVSEASGSSAAGGQIVVNLPRGYLADSTLISRTDAALVRALTEDEAMQRAFEFAKEQVGGTYTGNVDLVRNYLSYGFTFEYTGNEWYDEYGQLKTDGNGLPILPASKDSDCETGVRTSFALRITKGEKAVEGTIPFILVSKDVLDEYKALGRSVLSDAFSDYRQENNYILQNNILLPQKNGYFGVSFTYTADVYSAGGGKGDSALVTIGTGDNSVCYVEKPDSGEWVLVTPTMTRTVTVDGADSTVSVELEPFKFILRSSSNYEIAKNAMETADESAVYAAAPFVIYRPSDTLALRGMEVLSVLGVESVRFHLENNIFTKDNQESHHYYFKNGDGSDPDSFTGAGNPVLCVNGSTKDPDGNIIGDAAYLPDINKEIYLEATFVFASGTPREVTLRYRVYHSSTGEGEGEEGETAYLLHYNEILKLFRERTEGGKTYTTFRMPEEILKIDVRYSVSASSKDLLGLTLEMTASGADTADGLWRFRIDPKKLPLENQEVIVEIRFAPKGSGDDVWEKAKVREYSFQLYGLIQNSADGYFTGGTEDTRYGNIPDEALYTSVLGAVNLNESSFDKVLITERARILTSLRVKDLNVTRGFGGIQYLEGLTVLHAVNCHFAAAGFTDDFARIRELSLEELDLSSNGLTGDHLAQFDGFFTLKRLILNNNTFADYSKLKSMPRLTYFEARNCETTKIDNIVVLDALETLDVSNDPAVSSRRNRIAQFSKALNLSSLKVLDCYGNVDDDPAIHANGDNANEWADNFTTFVLLTDEKIKVYNGWDSVAGAKTLFEIPADRALVECVWVLEGIFHYQWSAGTFLVPKILTANSGTVYTLTWDFSAISGATWIEDPVDSTRILVTHAATGNFLIRATVVKSGGSGAADSVTRLYPIKLAGGAA